MSEVKHTPGPWWTTPSGVRDSGGYIAHTRSAQRYPGQDERYAFEVVQREADKHLIAAAPDLLEALIDVSQQARHSDYDWPLDLARAVDAAIAKATTPT